MRNSILTALIGALMILSSGHLKAQNKAIKFTNDTDQVSLNPFDPTAVSTIETWIKTTQTSTGTIINFRNIDTGYGFFIRVAGGKLQACQWDGGGWKNPSSTVTVNSGEWTHIAVVRNGSTVKMYVNGSPSGSSNQMQANVPDGINNLIIGKMYGATNESFKGQLDEMKIWNIARTEQEIKESYKNEAVGNEEGLVCYLKFDDEIKNSVDNTTGTLTGATFVDDPIVYTLKPTLHSAILAAQATNDKRPVGDRTGNVSQEAKDKITNIILEAQSCYDLETSTEDDYATHITNLSLATTEFNDAALPEYTFDILTLNPQGEYTITHIKDGKFIMNSRTEEDGETEINRPSTKTSTELLNPECYWSLIPSTAIEGKISIRARHIADGGLDFIDQAGRSCASSTFKDNIWANFTMVQDQESYISTSTHIGFKNVQSSHYLTVKEDGTLGSSAEPSYPFKIELITAVGTQAATEKEPRIWVENQTIQSNIPLKNILIYNQQGLQMDSNQKLPIGLYLVRMGETTQKVIIQK